MTETMETQEMAKTFYTATDTSVFGLNQKNFRNWEDYELKAKMEPEGFVSEQVIDDGETVLSSSRKLVFTAKSKDVQELVDSLLIYTENSCIFESIDPLLVTPKGAVDEGLYTLLGGNSRVYLLRQMIDLFTELGEQGYEFGFKPIKYQIKSDYQPSDLVTYQTKVNTGIPPSGFQKLQIVYNRRKELLEFHPNRYEGRVGKALLLKDLEELASPMTVSNAVKVFEGLSSFLLLLLDKGVIQNPQLAIEMQRVLDNPNYKDYIRDAQHLWEWMLTKAQDDLFDGKTPTATKKHLNAVVADIKEELQEDLTEEQDDAEKDDDSPEETSKPTAKALEMQRLRELDRETLNGEVLNLVGDLTDLVVAVDPEQYDQDDAIRLHILMTELIGSFKKVKTTVTKSLEAAQKKALDEAKASEKAAKKTVPAQEEVDD